MDQGQNTEPRVLESDELSSAQAGVNKPEQQVGEESSQSGTNSETQELRLQAERIGRAYPEFVKNGELSLPQEVMEQKEQGESLTEAVMHYDLKRTKAMYEELKAKYDAESANRTNAQATMGSLAGGEAVEKEYYTSQEWDRLPQKLREKFIKNGKVFDFMKKWAE